MTARIPYLSALTRPAAPATGQPGAGRGGRPPGTPAVLRPPGRLYVGQADQASQDNQALAAKPDFLLPLTPVTAERAVPTTPMTTWPQSRPSPAISGTEPSPVTDRGEPTAVDLRGPSAPTRVTREPAKSEPASRDQPGKVATTPRPNPGPNPGPGPGPASGDIAPRPRRPEISTPAVPSGPPESWTDPRWTLPVELPQTFKQKDSDGAVPRPEPSQSPGQPTSDRPQPVPSLTPSPPGPEPTLDVPRLSEPGAGRHRPADSRPAQLSIGTIEVTVVSPAPPATPPQPVRRDRPRPVSPAASPATSPAADRLKDGLRRWHGTAQG